MSMEQTLPEEQGKFQAWVDRQKEAGVIDIKFCARDLSEENKEDFFREMNQMVEAYESQSFLKNPDWY